MNSRDAPIGEDDLQAFIDERLSGERRSMMEAYLAQSPDTRERVAEDRRHRDALRARLERVAREPIPMRLRIANIQETRRGQRSRWLSSASLAAGIFLAGAAGGWFAGSVHPPVSPTSFIPRTAVVANDAIAAHQTFTVEVMHPVEVDASNEAHLVQWLSKRLGRRLAAPDLSQFGYRLMGGRLLPGGGGPAAQLMYDDVGGKRLTLYVQAAGGAATAFRFRQGKNESTFAWIDQGFGFAVTAASDRNALLPVAESVYHSFEEPEGRAIKD
ncbi:anti-sigma factor [Bradyrhizobium sp.]|uniref:anti-sigma factor family protein n=1 Tax=Bradyrhizobium sp. TaxID=376 RepID=UPI0025BDB4E1|nr:anti-sigma factor [Bradyrhizobium sp.]